MKSFILRAIRLITMIGSLICSSCKENGLQNENYLVKYGKTLTLFSKELNENREVWIYHPSESELYNKSKRYPVLYLLDGEDHFSSVVSLVQKLSSENGTPTPLCPEMIIVGIINTDRTRDLTPSNSALIDLKGYKNAGGAENFTRFMEKELIPFIDKNYLTTTHRSIIGHSFGGLYVTYTLLNHPHLFTNYIAIDPSLSWDRRKLLQQTVGQLIGDKYENKSMFVGIANTMNPNMDFNVVKKDTTRSTEHIRAILQFVESTELNNDGKFTFVSKYYENEGHITVPLIATYDALRSLYKWYELKESILKSYLEPDITSMEVINEINLHYKKVSNKMGYEVLPPEHLINILGYACIENHNKADLAYHLFKMNIENYPTSANAFDSMGDYFLFQQDTIKAIATFEKAISIEPLSFTKAKLEELRKVHKRSNLKKG